MTDYAAIFLTAWREKKDISVKQLVDLTGFEEEYIERLELNDVIYNPEILARLARALGIEPFRLFVHPAVQFDEKPNVNGITAEALTTLLKIYIPDVVSRLEKENMVGQLLDGTLPDEYWDVQSEKMIDLITFLKMCREDRTSALRGLFEPLTSEIPPPHNSD